MKAIRGGCGILCRENRRNCVCMEVGGNCIRKLGNQYYLYHKLIQYAIAHKGEIIQPYKDVFQKGENAKLDISDVIQIVDKLEGDNLITTFNGYGSEYKKIKINHNGLDFLKGGGYLHTNELKIHEVLRFLSEERERDPNKRSFDSSVINIILIFYRVDSQHLIVRKNQNNL